MTTRGLGGGTSILSRQDAKTPSRTATTAAHRAEALRHKTPAALPVNIGALLSKNGYLQITTLA